jgi:hypothetical protein
MMHPFQPKVLEKYFHSENQRSQEMNYRINLMTVSIYLIMTVAVFFSNACHFSGNFQKSAPTVSSMENSNLKNNASANHESYSLQHTEIPRTGQKTSYAAGDDGVLRKGKPWPAPRFTDNGDGTVTDHLSGLIWTQNADKADGPIDWEQAILGARTCTDGRYSDWRLPNRNELESLIDLGRYNPALPEGHLFTGIQTSYYWTSTTPANNGDHAWIIHFYIGLVSHDDKGGSHYVWYVR